MMQFDGYNPRSIAIMDNLAVHRVAEILALFCDMGILVLFLPPYSPDLNPLEECFSFVKSYLKRHTELLQVIPDASCIIKSAFDSVTHQQCEGWIHNSGYNTI